MASADIGRGCSLGLVSSWVRYGAVTGSFLFFFNFLNKKNGGGDPATDRLNLVRRPN